MASSGISCLSFAQREDAENLPPLPTPPGGVSRRRPAGSPSLSDRVLNFFESIPKLLAEGDASGSFLCPAGIARAPLCSLEWPCNDPHAYNRELEPRASPAPSFTDCDAVHLRIRTRTLLSTVGAGLASTRAALGELGFFSHFDGASLPQLDWTQAEGRPLPQLIEGVRGLQKELRFLRVAVTGVSPCGESAQSAEAALEDAVLELAEAQQLAEATDDEAARVQSQRLRLAAIERILASPSKDHGPVALSTRLEARRWCHLAETVLRRGRALAQAGPACFTSAPFLYPLVSCPALALSEAPFFAELVPHAASAELCLAIFVLHHWLLAQGPGFDLLVPAAVPLTPRLAAMHELLRMAVDELDRRRSRHFTDVPRKSLPSAALQDRIRGIAGRSQSRDAMAEVEAQRRLWLQSEAAAAASGPRDPLGWRGSQAAAAGACFRDRGTGLLRRSILTSLAALRDSDPEALRVISQHGPQALPCLAVHGKRFLDIVAAYVGQFEESRP
eukprot:tig00000849_g4782.t1